MVTEPSDENHRSLQRGCSARETVPHPVHCAEPSHDGLVYVCDRPNDRVQVFELDGTFVKEKRIAKETLGDGAVWDIAFSKDADRNTSTLPMVRT